MHSTYRSQKLVMPLSICEIEPLLLSRGRIKGVHCEVLLARLLHLTNHISSNKTSKGSIALAALGSRATAHHCLRRNTDDGQGSCTTSTFLKHAWKGGAAFSGYGRNPAQKVLARGNPVQSRRTVTCASPSPAPDGGSVVAFRSF